MGTKRSGNRTASNPRVAARADMIDPTDNSRSIAFLRELMKLPSLDFSSDEEVEARTDLYLDKCAEHGMRPLLASYALALGIDRQTLYDVRKGNGRAALGVTPSTRDFIQKTSSLIESSLANQLITAKSGQVGLIFALKQHGWKDTVEVTADVKDDRTLRERMLSEGKSAKEIAAGYAEIVGVEDVEKVGAKALPEGK